jgi:hypothetical protein
MINKSSFIVLTIVLMAACSSPKKSQHSEYTDIPEPVVVDLYNEPAAGFNMEGSDQTAMLIADKSMVAMGGRSAWDKTNVISWNFFGARKLLWDKKNNKVRVDYLKEDLSISLNMSEMSGKVWINGQEITNEDSLAGYLADAKSAWINDSYWLVMPFKLKDSGVTLEYYGEDNTEAGVKADVLRLTFEGVGDTPHNAYHVWVDVDDRLIKQWAWYADALDQNPRFVRPWEDYRPYGDILLSGERGDRDITEIGVMEVAPDGIFENLSPKI